ncbi:CocE/NonD family hydrolase, partial [Amycolatopsis mediterranei]
YPDRSFGLAGSIKTAGITEEHLRFFDRWVRGRPGDTPRVRLFVMGADEWRDEPDWPLPDTRYTDLFLDGGGRAGTAAGDGVLTRDVPAEDATDTFRYDPRDPVPSLGGTVLAAAPGAYPGPADQAAAETREDVLCFTTPVLRWPVEVTGHVTLVLHIRSSTPDTDFTGKLVDVHPDGRAILLCEGIQRVRYRESLTEPALLAPGTVAELTLDLGVTANVFRPGHRIRLEVSSSNFPRYDRNTNTGATIATDDADAVVVAVNHVLHGPVHPSRLILPVIGRSPSEEDRA